jgi:ribosomal protein L37AE/L43A
MTADFGLAAMVILGIGYQMDNKESLAMEEWHKRYPPFPQCDMAATESIKMFGSWPCRKCKKCLSAGMYVKNFWQKIAYLKPFRLVKRWRANRYWRKLNERN